MDSARLGQRLVARLHLDQADVATAVQRQVVQGGGLDTCLLEAGVVDEPRLLAALAGLHGVPAAGRRDIDAIGAHLPRLFPREFAETYRMVPASLYGPELAVLCHGAPDPELMRRIGERLQLRVAPLTTSEVRLHYAMHRLYGVTLLPRFAALLTRLDGDSRTCAG